MAADQGVEVILGDEVQRLLDTFAAALRVRVALYGPDGAIITTNHHLRNSEYCQLIQKILPGRCEALDASKQAECLVKGSLQCYRCHGGLKEAVAPVMADNRLAGFVLIGQFRDTERPPADMPQGRRGDASAAQLRRAFNKLPFVETERLDDILGMFMMLVDYIVARELVGLRGDWVFEKARRYIERHLSEAIRLEDVARHVGRSVSSLAHLLRNRYGTTFKRLLIERRLELVEKLMRSRPELSIGEAAATAGFEDRFYFSRIYRKYRHRTPSQQRKEDHSAASLAKP